MRWLVGPWRGNGAPWRSRRLANSPAALGADAVVITAAASSNAPVELAAELSRDRARGVMVGVTGMNIPRKLYYEKEASVIVSRSSGPGRYDPQYEQHGHDYPAGLCALDRGEESRGVFRLGGGRRRSARGGDDA